MQFNVDSYIEIGKSHEICEDYATHGFINDIPYIILSDGCSSSKDTDVGSRLLVYACRNALQELLHNNLIENLCDSQLEQYMKEQILFNLKLSLKALSLKYTVADATLLFSFVYNQNVYTFIYGDGHAIIKYTDGTVESMNIEFEDNAPSYISYDLDIMRKEAYVNQYGDGMVTEYSYDDINQLKSESSWVTVKSWLFSNSCHSSIDNIDDIQSITIASDGIESYMYGKTSTPTDTERIDINNVMKWHKEYTRYKNVLGEFVKRRMKRIKLNNEKNNIEHFDDVSCATIWINHE